MFTNKPALAFQPREPLSRDYDYPSKPPVDHPPYYKGKYTSPVGVTFPPRSPVSHSHPADSMSPPTQAPVAASPKARHSIISAGTLTPAAQHSPTAPSVLKAPAPPASVRPPRHRPWFRYIADLSSYRHLVAISCLFPTSYPVPNPSPDPELLLLPPLSSIRL